MSQFRNLGKASDKHFEAARYEIDINYLGVIRLNNLFIEMLKGREESAIINTSSILSYVPLNLAPTYSATKAAMHFYTVSLRNHLEISRCKVKVFELLPPVVATSMTENLDSKGISTEKLVNALIAGIKKDKFTIRVGDTRLVYLINRFFPKMAFRLVNPVKNSALLQS